MDNSAAESSGKFEVVKYCYPAHGYAIFWTDLIRGQVVDFQKVNHMAKLMHSHSAQPINGCYVCNWCLFSKGICSLPIITCYILDVIEPEKVQYIVLDMQTFLSSCHV